jgi:K+-transporting ATPase KdpF subunit
LHDFEQPSRLYTAFTRRSANCALFFRSRRYLAAPARRDRGPRIHQRRRRLFAVDLRVGRRLRGTGEKEVSWAYILSGAAAFALLIYLVVALIRAEDL